MARYVAIQLQAVLDRITDATLRDAVSAEAPTSIQPADLCADRTNRSNLARNK